MHSGKTIKHVRRLFLHCCRWLFSRKNIGIIWKYGMRWRVSHLWKSPQCLKFLWGVFWKWIQFQQVCIPVGYLPPACWPYPSMHCAGGVCIPACTAQEWVYPSMSEHGGCLPGGGAVCPGECLPRGCLPGVCLPGGSAQGTPPLWIEWQTDVKTLPSRNFIAGGNNVILSGKFTCFSQHVG